MKRNKWFLGRALPASVLAATMFASPLSGVVAKAAPTVTTQSVAPISTGTKIFMNTTQITHAKPSGLDTTKPVKWTTSDPYVAYVDTIGNAKGDYSGKILGVSGGSAKITGVGVDPNGNPATVNITVTVVESQAITNLEKVVYYYNAGDASIPIALSSTQWETKNIPTPPTGTKFPSKSYVGYVDGENGVKWLISKDTLIKSNNNVNFGEEKEHAVITGIVSDAITLYDPNLAPVDQIQYLQGGRYIPQAGGSSGSGVDKNGNPATFNAKEIITNIMPDGNNGLWVLGANGNATHIVRKQMSLMGKSLVQEEISRNFADRYGFQSGNTSFTTQADMIKALMTGDKTATRTNGDTDNDGLWTTMYASGEMWRYNYMKENFGENDARTIDAKASAVRAVEAIVTLGYISGGQLKVPSKNNVNDVLYIVKSLGGNVSTVEEGNNWLATNEGKPVYVDENGKYTLTDTGKPASSGFFARTYKVDGSNNGATVAETKTHDSNWLQKKAGTTTDVNGKTVNYSVPGSYKAGTNGQKAYDTVAVPPRLTTIVNDQNPDLDDETKALDSNKVYYKATTSTDELVGHYFALDLAYSTFKDSDPELAALVKNDLINHTNAVILNNYYQVSINGENPVEKRFQSSPLPGDGLNAPSNPTSWGNMNPEFLDGVSNAWDRNDYEDGPLNATLALQMLVAARDMGTYTSKEKAALEAQGINVATPLDYANEYKVMNGVKEKSANAHNDYEARYPKSVHSTSLLDMSLQYHSRYFGISAHNGDDIGVSGVSYEAYMNYSDEEEAALSYYTLSHHAEKMNVKGILDGMNQWWFNEKREKNPFMTTFYAASIGALKDKGFDIGHPTVDLAGSTWHMTRIPNNFIKWDSLSANRNDVTHVAPDFMVDQLIPRDEIQMSKYNTNIFGTMDRRTIDSTNSNTLDAATVTSMPYWLTQNPEDASYVEALGSSVTNPVNKGTESITYPTNLAEENPTAKYNEETHTFTINVGDSVKLDAKTTGYIKNVAWLTNAWDLAGYNNGLPSQINADSNLSGVIDLRGLATYGDVGGVSPTKLSANGEYYGAYATALRPGTVTVTGYVEDGFFRAPQKITYTIKVVDPSKTAEKVAPATIDQNVFSYPTWLKQAMNEEGLNTEGHKNISVSYTSSSPTDVTVDEESGAVTYNTDKAANIIATVTYSGMTLNGEPRFEDDSHVMTFVRTVSKDAKQTVSFNSQGGSAVNPITATYNQAITAPTPTKTGYTFLGWYKDASCTQAWNFATDTVTASTTLYAKWGIGKYTVTFNSKGGSNVATITGNYGSIIAKPANPTKKGFVFAGWYKDAGLKTAWNFTTDKVKENTTLYAKWDVAKAAGLKATKASTTSIKLNWTGVSGVSGYEIVRATKSDFSDQTTKTTTTGTYTSTGLVKGKTYYFKVRAFTLDGKVKVYGSYTTVIKFKL